MKGYRMFIQRKLCKLIPVIYEQTNGRNYWVCQLNAHNENNYHIKSTLGYVSFLLIVTNGEEYLTPTFQNTVIKQERFRIFRTHSNGI